MERLKRFSELIETSPYFLYDPDIDCIKSTVSDKNVLNIRRSLERFLEYFKKDVYNYDFQNYNDKLLQEIITITTEAEKNCRGAIDSFIFDFFLKEIASLFEFVENETEMNAEFTEHIFMKKILRIQKILIIMGFDPILDIPIKDQTKLVLYIGGSLDEVTADKQAITDYSILGILTWGILNKCIRIANSVRKKRLATSLNKNSFVEILSPNGYMNCSEYFKLGSLLFLNYTRLFRLMNVQAKMYLAIGPECFVVERTVPIEIRYLENSEKIYDYYHPGILLFDDSTSDLGQFEITSSFIRNTKLKCTLREVTDMRFTELRQNHTVVEYSSIRLQSPKYFLSHNLKYKENVATDGFFNTSTLYFSDGHPVMDRAELLECQRRNISMFMRLETQLQLLLNFKCQKNNRELEEYFNKWKKFVILKRIEKNKTQVRTNITITKDIEICELVPTMAKELYEVVDKNRGHLKEHLVWTEKIQSVANELRFIESINRDTRNAFVILYRDEIIGVIDYTKSKDKLDISYWIAKDYEGKGIITKCCKKIIEYGFIDLKLEKITIHMYTSNPKSEAVAKRLGLKFTGIEESNQQPNVFGKNRYEMSLKDFNQSKTTRIL